MNIITDTSFAFTSPTTLPSPQGSSPATQSPISLAGPGLAGGGLPAITQPAPSTSSSTIDERPLIDRAMDLVKEVIQSAVSQLFELLQSGINQLLESLLAAKPSSTTNALPSTTNTTADSATAAEKFGQILDGVATAANVLVLGRGALGFAGRIKGGVINGAKSVATFFEKAMVSPELLRTLGSRIKSAL